MLVFATEMEGLSPELDELCAKGAKEAFAELDLVELNSAIFRADGEERDAGTSLSLLSRVGESGADFAPL